MQDCDGRSRSIGDKIIDALPWFVILSALALVAWLLVGAAASAKDLLAL